MIVKKEFSAEGMHCRSCEKIIGKQIKKINGVKDFHIDYATQKGWVRFDPEKTSFEEIMQSIEEKGYSCSMDSGKQDISLKSRIKPAVLTMGLLAILLGGYQFAENSFGVGIFPEVGQASSIALLFVLGLLTGFHCIGMCGGFVVSYASKNGRGKLLNIKSHLQYGSGKVLSYTVIGAVFGLIGSVFVFTPMIRGIAAIFAGIFLIFFGINTLNIFPALRRVRIPQPGFVSKIRIDREGSPMKIGLLNGLMIACGPLQALYIYAAGTGSAVSGATALFAFGLGTLPVLFGFGMFASFVSRSMTRNILKVSGIIVLFLGIIMLNRGLALTGTGYDANSIFASASAAPYTGEPNNISADGYQEIRMDVTKEGWVPNRFVLKTGVPVRWIINGKEITSCNNAIQVPKLGMKFDVKPGEQVIEFTPTEEGTIPFSCWMGMIPGVFIVENGTTSDDTQGSLDSIQLPSTGSCGGSCGGPTCGAATKGTCGCGG